ncbi:hypothetical protein [Montanilutibacter psychrotolerans]|nr:hypothetical protein [Lysobacter psychrotolerans]
MNHQHVAPDAVHGATGHTELRRHHGIRMIAMGRDLEFDPA